MQHQSSGQYPLDIVRVGDLAGPSAGTDDPTLLAWAAEHNRILISLDKTTLPAALLTHLETNGSSPGVVLLHETLTAVQIVELLLLISHASTASEWANAYQWIP